MAVKQTEVKLEIPAPNLKLLKVKLVGTTPIIFHKFSVKNKRMMLEKQMKAAKSNVREKRDPVQEYYDCYYLNEDGQVSAKVDQLKKSAVEAARNLSGVTMTLLRGSVFIIGDKDNLIPVLVKGKPITLSPKSKFELYPEDQRGVDDIWGNDPKYPNNVFMREDVVVLMKGASDLRYRPMIRDWELEFLVKFNADVISAEQVLNLFQVAGFANGLCEWRPQKDGSFGTYEVAHSTKKADK